MVLTYYPCSDSPNNIQEAEERRLHFYEKGDKIPLMPQGLWQVYLGIIQLSKPQENGDEILLGWLKPGDFFGNWLSSKEIVSAKALGEVYLKWFTGSEIENSPQLTYIILKQFIRRQEQTEALLAIAGLRRVEQRLQELLILLKEDIGEETPEGKRLSVRLTHQILASAIGTTRVTVTRLLGEFQRQGWLKLDRDRHIIILKG